MRTFTLAQRRTFFAFLYAPMLTAVVFTIVSFLVFLFSESMALVPLALGVGIIVLFSVYTVFILVGLPVHLLFASRKITSIWIYLGTAILIATLLILLENTLEVFNKSPLFSPENFVLGSIFYSVALVSTGFAYFIRWPEKWRLLKRSH